MELCERAAVEQDPQPASETGGENDRLLSEKEQRLTKKNG
jgi:hypothetical protein